jgi:hypothetical protein
MANRTRHLSGLNGNRQTAFLPRRQTVPFDRQHSVFGGKLATRSDGIKTVRGLGAASWGPKLTGDQRSPTDAGQRAATGHPVDAARTGPEARIGADAVTGSHRGRVAIARGTGGRPGQRGLAGAPWPLIAVLGVQAVLSLRLIWSNTAFQDEALYLRAGHLELAQWLHQTPIPNFPAYFSGAPILYPPLGALADSIGGLAAARILSLCFMLGVTSLLWAATGRLYGQRAALLATALFATLAGTQFLGAFATFDAMSLFLLALGAWLGVRSADCQFGPRTALLVTTGTILAIADAVKYAAALFTPVVLVVVALAASRWHGVAGVTSDCARHLAHPRGHSHRRQRAGLLAWHYD